MRSVVLESFVGSNYADSPDSYEFPPQYLNHFEPLSRGEPMVAVIYEPRGDANEGRMAFVGWATLSAPPVPSGRRNSRNQVLYRVQYASRYREFDRIVGREATGEPVETWLRAIPRGRERDVATFGRAVRPLIESDLELIFSIGFPAGVQRTLVDPSAPHSIGEVITVQERQRRLISTFEREAGFRDEVLAAYQHRCAISGLSVGPAPSRAYGLVDAAHIRPVAERGADQVSNGLALTPTLHRLFDKGLFTVEYRGDALTLKASHALRDEMIVGREGFALRLRTGLELELPAADHQRPSPAQIEFHQTHVFARA
jgi:putative restriction endonuclease